MEWLRIDQGGMCRVNLFHLREFPGVPLWSLTISSVAVGGHLGHYGDLVRHKKYCNDQPLYQNNQNFTVGVAGFFTEGGSH